MERRDFRLRKYSILESGSVSYLVRPGYWEVVKSEAGEVGKNDQIMKDLVCYSKEIGLIMREVGKH